MKMICNCGKLVGESENIPLEERKPCSSCGSRNRQFFREILVTGEGHVSLGMKASDTSGKIFLKSFNGWDLFRKIGKWMKKEQVFDHRNDLYREIVTDPETGDIIHHCEERLSDHLGHGDDKTNTVRR